MYLSEKYRYIVIEGPIGGGKTTLAKRLADHYPIDLLLENPEANPFLPRFYQDVQRYALPTQLSFLFQRTEQLRYLAEHPSTDRTVISDFFIEKDPLFARLNLDDEEYALYEKIYQRLNVPSVKPDLVIYLQTPLEKLIERVAERNVGYEKNIPREYLQRLSDTYSEFFHNYTASPLLIINNENLNVAKNDDALDLLVNQIRQMRGGREFFNPNLE